MKPMIGVWIVVAAASSLAGCAAAGDQAAVELVRGDYRAVSDCGYSRLSRHYGGLRRENMDQIAVREVHYDVGSDHSGYVGFEAVGHGRTRVEYRAKAGGRDGLWNVPQLQADLAGCSGRR